jgi:hypothetical protein
MEVDMKRITDLQGYFLRDDFWFNPVTEIGLDVEPAQGMYRARWNGFAWVESGTPPTPQPIEPTIEERVVTIEETLEVLLL